MILTAHLILAQRLRCNGVIDFHIQTIITRCKCSLFTGIQRQELDDLVPPCRQGGELDIPATSLVTMRPLFVKSQAHSKDGTSCLVSRDSEGEAALLEEMLYSQVHGPFPWSRRAAVVEVVADLGIRATGGEMVWTSRHVGA